MKKVDIKEIKRLKQLTGVGVTDAKRALSEADGDFDKALEAMRVKGLSKADKKSEREARAGLVDSYVHSGRIGVVVEINCETDFVARTDDFKTLGHDVAMHIAASSPRFVTRHDIPKKELNKEQDLIKQQLANEGKPKAMIDKIAAGKLKKWYAEVCLVDQPFIKNPDETVGDLVKQHIAKLGENIVVRRFGRIELGGSD
ncbi:MAG TPA: translation elongation factor Ts [Candidatus Saccharimonadales bacterium]